MRGIIGKILWAIGLLIVMSLFLQTTLQAQSLGLQPYASHTVGLHADGTVYTWGHNKYGQLGDGTWDNDRETPVKVLKGEYNGTTYLGDNSSNKIIAVALGYEHSIALAEDGIVYTWGSNAHGKLGDGTTTRKLTPVKVLKGAYDGTTHLGDKPTNKIIAVALGFEHSIALAADGTVYTWGDNTWGKLGDGTTADKLTPVKVLKGEYNGAIYLGDKPTNKIIAVALGGQHSIALAADGTVYTWGYNNVGQLGDGTTAERHTPVKVLKGAYDGTTHLGDEPTNKITAVALGWRHSIALAQDGTVYAWGSNVWGECGDGRTWQPWERHTPVKVLKGEYNGATYLGDNSSNKITAVALGYNHSVALAADGTVYTWGYNGYGQLGDGTADAKYTPVKVLGVGGVGVLSLPVELTSFTATVGDGQVTLQWRTETEVNNIGFAIYRSDAKNGQYTKIGWMDGAGNSAMPHDYQFLDKKVEVGKTYFYYIEDVDIAGEQDKSDIIQITVTPQPRPRAVIPTKFALLQNYPNPFNPDTWLPHQLAEGIDVTIRIYNVSGQLIKGLPLGYREAGYYITRDKAAYWDGTNQSGEKVSSGVYFYQLQAGDFTATRKMLMVK